MPNIVTSLKTSLVSVKRPQKRGFLIVNGSWPYWPFNALMMFGTINFRFFILGLWLRKIQSLFYKYWWLDYNHCQCYKPLALVPWKWSSPPSSQPMCWVFHRIEADHVLSCKAQLPFALHVFIFVLLHSPSNSMLHGWNPITKLEGMEGSHIGHDWLLPQSWSDTHNYKAKETWDWVIYLYSMGRLPPFFSFFLFWD